MIIESLELKNYRNYKELHMDLHPGTNVLYGDNAQGKTNILESMPPPSPTREAGTERSSISGRTSPTSK